EGDGRQRGSRATQLRHRERPLRRRRVDANRTRRRAHPAPTGAGEPRAGRPRPSARAHPSRSPSCPPSLRFSVIEAFMRAFLFLLLTACGSDASTEKPTEAPAVIILPEDLAEVRKEPISMGPRISGTLKAAEMAVL